MMGHYDTKSSKSNLKARLEESLMLCNGQIIRNYLVNNNWISILQVPAPAVLAAHASRLIRNLLLIKVYIGMYLLSKGLREEIVYP